jgi:hypothetical protein
MQQPQYSYAQPPPSYYAPTNMIVQTVPVVQQVVYQQPMIQQDQPPQKSSGEMYRDIVTRYEISTDYAVKMRQLEGFEIVVIADDSGSMNEPSSVGGNPYESKMTRWDELKKTVSVIVEVASLMDPTGVDVYFLNRSPLIGVKDAHQLDETFKTLPGGLTPICPVLRKILKEKASVVRERKLLIVIATDGLPTTDNGNSDVDTLKYILKNERNPLNKIFVTFLACTNDDDAVGYLNKLDKEIKNVDTVDDYASELKEVRRIQGQHVKFSYGDYVVKSLIGSVDEKFDNLDEKKAGGCCVIL